MSLSDRISLVKNKIHQAEKASGRKANSVALIGVTKGVSSSDIRAAHACGVQRFGENYAQEIRPKINDLKELKIEWHFIGHLQTNKVKLIADQTAVIHSVDSIKIAKEISNRSADPQKILIELNLAKESSKNGVSAEEMPALIEKIQQLPRLILCGIMFMPPVALTGPEQKKYFYQAREIQEKLTAQVSRPHSLVELSMGTSHDFHEAILAGATMVRVGTEIFGERK